MRTELTTRKVTGSWLLLRRKASRVLSKTVEVYSLVRRLRKRRAT